MAVIQTMGLSKRYKDRWAVDHLDLRVEQGDIYGFIGQNGAGKSTTLKLLCGLARPTQGEALISASRSGTRWPAAGWARSLSSRGSTRT